MEFERLELLIGKDLEVLRDKCILVLGLGGVGGYVTEALARSGINHLILVDFDKVDITNLNRQIIGLYSNIGKYKTDCFEERIKDINKDCRVEKYTLFYNEETKDAIFNNRVDYVIDCCDSINSKKLIIEECQRRNINIISCMGTGNKFHPELFKIDKIKNTSYDPLAKKLRYMLKDNKELLETKVLYSQEEPVKTQDKIGSNSYTPSVAGLLIASYVINDIIGR